MTNLRCVAESHDHLGEGPLWVASEGRLYWFDILGRSLNWRDHATGESGRFDLGVRASVAAPRTGGGLVLVTEVGLGHFDTRTGRLEIRAPFDLGEGFRTNDGKIDMMGRLWWSSMDADGGKRPGAIFRTDPDGRTTQVLDGIHIANAVAFDAAGTTLYLADSARKIIWAFALAPDGALGERRVYATTETGSPDGAAIDGEGCLWNCEWGAGRIVRRVASGTVVRAVELPVQQVTSCIFGGPDLATLYITTARESLEGDALAAQPLAGRLFAFEPGVAGLALPTFSGRIGNEA